MKFTRLAGYHRKHALRVLAHEQLSERRTRMRARLYGEATRQALFVLWEASDRLCGKRLSRRLIPTLIAAMERHGHAATNTPHNSMRSANELQTRPIDSDGNEWQPKSSTEQERYRPISRSANHRTWVRLSPRSKPVHA